MELIIQPDERDIATIVADAITSLLDRTPDAVLGLATGSSPLAVYDELVRRYEAGQMSFARARAFMLDEYVGLAADHPQRYRNVIKTEFTGRVDIPAEAVQGPDGLGEDVPAACAAYEQAIAAAGRVDLPSLGIGTAGHIAINDPRSSLASRTRRQTLTRHPPPDNARLLHGDQVQDAAHRRAQ